MTSRKNTNRSAARNLTNHPAVSVAAKAVEKVEERKVDQNLSALERIEPDMAIAIRKMAAKVIGEMIQEAEYLTGKSAKTEWFLFKDVKTALKEVVISRMYDSNSLGSLSLRGLEKKAAKEALWEALNADQEVIRIKEDHARFEVKAAAGFTKKNTWNLEGQKSKNGAKVFNESEVGGIDDWRKYQAERRQATS
jgi:hypothetical protein